MNVVGSELSDVAVARSVRRPGGEEGRARGPPAQSTGAGRSPEWTRTPPDAVAVPSPVTLPVPPVFAKLPEVVLSPVSRLPAASRTSTVSVRVAPEERSAAELVKVR